jgi:hypothetical protein
LFASASLAAQAPASKEILDTFCKLDVAGRQLSLDGQNDIAKLLSNEKHWEPQPEVIVTKDFSIRDLGIRKETAEFAVDYRVLGRLDSSITFTHQQTPYSGDPIIQSERFSLIFSDVHLTMGPDGRWQQAKGSPGWRIRITPGSPHVGISAAIRYVESISFKSKDPLIKANSQKTLAELERLYRTENLRSQLASPIQPPETVLSQMISLETNGIGLSADGRRQFDAFFQHPSPWARGRIHVSKGYEVKTAKSLGSTAELYVEYGAVGELDSMLRLTDAPRGRIAREDYHLILNDKYSLRSNPAKEFVGPSRWQITDAHPQQWISVDAAIRYVTETRNATSDPALRQNADKTLAALARYR